VFKSKVPRK